MLIQCPHKVLPPETWDAFMAADLAKKGAWPADAAWLSNAASCVEAVRWVWAEDARYRAELKIKDSD